MPHRINLIFMQPQNGMAEFFIKSILHPFGLSAPRQVSFLVMTIYCCLHFSTKNQHDCPKCDSAANVFKLLTERFVFTHSDLWLFFDNLCLGDFSTAEVSNLEFP